MINKYNLMNAKYHRLQEKIQMISKINKESSNTEEDLLPVNESSKKSHTFTSTIPIPRYTKLEIRLKTLEDLFESSMSNIEMKHAALQEYLSKIKANIDLSAIADEKDRDERINQVYSIENSLLLQVAEESAGLDAYIENAMNKTETKMMQLDNKMTQESEFNRNGCSLVLENANKDTESIASKLQELTIEQQKTNDQITQDISDRLNEGHEMIKSNQNNNMLFFNNQYAKMKQIKYYAQKNNQEEDICREEFNDNMTKMLNETEESLNKY